VPPVTEEVNCTGVLRQVEPVADTVTLLGATGFGITVTVKTVLVAGLGLPVSDTVALYW
jgi:hypothetical protein